MFSHCARVDAWLTDRFSTRYKDEEVPDFEERIVTIAQRVYNDTIDLRTIVRQVEEDDTDEYFMWSRYLPLPSHTQFVEAGVKEAKVVSTTGRSEEIQSCYAILRAALIRSEEVSLNDLSAPAKAEMFWRATMDHREHQDSLIEEYDSRDDYDGAITEIVKSLKTHHYKQVRENDLIERLNNVGNKTRKENVRQKTKGVSKTATMMGLIPYSQVTLKNNGLSDLKLELIERGLDEAATLNKITELKEALKTHELQRVKEAEYEGDTDEEIAEKRATAEKLADKYFKQLSAHDLFNKSD